MAATPMEITTTTTTTDSANKRKRNDDEETSSVDSSFFSPRKKSKVREFYMSDVYGERFEVPFAAEVRTKIICTIGPDSGTPEMLSRLLEMGMSVARFNFSHGRMGEYDWFRNTIQLVREQAALQHKTCAIMLDTKGPEIRTGPLKDGKPVILQKGNTFTIVVDPSFVGDEHAVAVTHAGILKDVSVGDMLMIDDGLISLTITEVTSAQIVCLVANSGELGERKGVNIPGKPVSLPGVTEKDAADIAFGVEIGVDIIAASFIRTAAHVEEVRALPGVAEAGIHIVSKIESDEGIVNFDAILAASDAIMVARGDLGVEIPIEQVCNEQKRMIWKCNVAGKPVITATQMLDSMIRFPRPTRAEATDVANAVFDGTDCVMLSGETAKGQYPIEAVQVMARICVASEDAINYSERYSKIRKAVPVPISHSETIASSAAKSAFDLGAKLIIVLTESGRTARLISKYRPSCIIMALTDVPKTAANLLLVRSVVPVLLKRRIDVNEDVIRVGMYEAVENHIVDSGDQIVVVSGSIAGVSGRTNTIQVRTVP